MSPTLWLLPIVLMLHACGPTAPAQRQTLDACMGPAGPDCKILVHLDYDPTVIRVVGKSGPEVAASQLTISAALRSPDPALSTRPQGMIETDIRLVYATPEGELRHWLSDSGTFRYPVNRIEGGLRTLAESERGDTGQSFVVPAESDASVFFICTKPYRTAAGNVSEETLCQVHAPLGEFVFITYPIRRLRLQDWRELHAAVMRDISAALNTKVIRRGL
jgi:hypothetical protein